MPGFAAVRGFEHAAARAAVLIAVFPWAKPHFPQRSVDNVGIQRIDLHVGSADVRVFSQNFLPVLPAIGREKDSPLLVGTVRMAERRSEYPIGVARIDRQCRNALRVVQAQVRPSLPCVGGFVNAVAN